jgi:hypothetical protein
LRAREVDFRFRAVEADRFLVPEVVRFRVPEVVRFRVPLAARRFRVAAAFRADADRAALGRRAAARAPFFPPFFDGPRLGFLPRPDPLFFPPPDSSFTVAQARRAASARETPRFSYPSSICRARRFCFAVYDDLSPRGMQCSPNELTARSPHYRRGAV